MSDPQKLIIINNDTVMFNPSTFLPAIAIPPVVLKKITASGSTKVHKKKLCVELDEESVIKKSRYFTPAFPKPGQGMFIITQLDTSQTTKKTNENEKAIIIKGTQFKAAFIVTGPAINPGTGVSDGKPSYTGGKGLFLILGNSTVFAG